MTSDEKWEVARSFFADSVKPQHLEVTEQQRKAGCMWNSCVSPLLSCHGHGVIVERSVFPFPRVPLITRHCFHEASVAPYRQLQYGNLCYQQASIILYLQS